MRPARIPVIALAGLLLAGFDSQKTDVLMKRYVETGQSEDFCRCGLTLTEEALGPKFLEAMYLQAIGKSTEYEKALLEMVAENPEAFENIEGVERSIQERCGT